MPRDNMTPRRDDTHELMPIYTDPEGHVRVNPSYSDDESDDDTPHAGLLHKPQSAYPKIKPSLAQRIAGLFTLPGKTTHAGVRPGAGPVSYAIFSKRLLFAALGFLVAITLIVAVFFPSYTSPPSRYTILRKRINGSEGPGAGNPENQKVFIAASIFDPDGTLAGGKWGECVLALIHILGPRNVYLSVYENDAGEVGHDALEQFAERVECEHTLKFDAHLEYSQADHITLPDGSDRVRRVAYLSEARNKALLPLTSSKTQYDKLLYLNDVVFDPVEMAQLLFLTGTEGTPSESGIVSATSYRAACAVDFINPVKFYDTFATRDQDGYGIGLPFFPWFTTAGQGTSRKQVLSGSDAIPVRSCWGGAVAFDARFFQQIENVQAPKTAAMTASESRSPPYSFRGSQELFWDASECCLIHADIQHPDPKHGSEIFMNPYVRTAYDWNTLQWLGFARRFERLYSPVHWIISKIVGMPWYNPRREFIPGEHVIQRTWTGSAFQEVGRTADVGGFCGRKGLQLMKTDRSGGGKPWEEYPVPKG